MDAEKGVKEELSMCFHFDAAPFWLYESLLSEIWNINFQYKDDRYSLQHLLFQAFVNYCISGAGLDVCTPEPLPADHPLLTCDNVTILPHTGSATTQARLAMANLAVDNVLAFVEGKKMPTLVKL